MAEQPHPAWDPPRPDDRARLKEAARARRAWDVIYHAKRLLQINADDADAVQALAALREPDLLHRRSAGEDLEINPLLGSMDRHSRLEFLRAAHLAERDTGDVLCRQDDDGNTMFLVVRGAVGVFSAGAARRLGEPAFQLEPGQLVGELAFALHRKRTATLQCLAKTALLSFNYQHLRTLLRDSPFGARIEEKMTQFLNGRVLEYLCNNVSYLVGKDRSGPLAKVDEPWEYLLGHTTFLTCSWKSDPAISREDDRFRGDGLYVLVGGKLRDTSDPERCLHGTDLPVVYAAFPGQVVGGSPKYAVEEDARIVHLSRAAFETPLFDRETFRGVVEAVRTALVRQAGRLPAGAAEEAFSSQTVLIHYPAPVAVAYQRFCQQREPAPRLERLFKALEATLKYLTFVGLSDLFHCWARPERRPAALPGHPAFEFLRRPVKMTLGRWAEALRETARALGREQERFVRELPGVCQAGGHFDANILAWIIASRNVAEHVEGSLPLAEDECREMIRQVRPRLEEAFQHLHFLRSYPLGFVIEAEGTPSAGGRRYYVHPCTGARPAAEEPYVIDTAASLVQRTPFLAAPDGSRLLYLWPLLLERVGEHTGQDALFVFERIADGGSFLSKGRWAAIDQRAAHEADLGPAGARDHAWLWEELGRRPPVVDLGGDLRLAQGLVPARRGALVDRTLGTNRLLAVIASGGCGTVYAAESADGRRVAVKVLELRDRAAQYPRFKQELETLRRAAEHPNIIKCFDADSTLVGGRDYPWYAMEFASGGDLTGRINERRGEAGELPWDNPAWRAEIVHEFRSIAAAVAHLHGLNIVHRDLKPGNVLVMDDGELRLSDFGLVKAIDLPGPSLTSIGAVLGTRRYMAPEQEQGLEVGRATDVYALGIVLVELASGQRPEPNTRVAQGSTLQQCPFLSRLPPPLRAFIGRCTDASPDRRPADARQVHDEFVALVGGR